jgi:SPP1 family predicted phage head-tail adaptor
MINAGAYNKRITIYRATETEDKDGFSVKTEAVILSVWAKVKTTKGFTLITSNTDFEKAYTNFTIRYPNAEITRDMFIRYNGKVYTIEYLNNIDEANKELEIQAKEVTK